MNPRIYYFAAGIAAALSVLGFIYLYLSTPSMSTAPVSSFTTFHLASDELVSAKQAGSAGDCAAAYRVANHYSFASWQPDDAIQWLRISARCPNANAKAALVYMLLGPGDKGDISKEIDRLLVELDGIDPGQAKQARKEVEQRRSGKR